MKFEYEPINDFMLCVPVEHNKTAGGLALPEGTEIGPPSVKVLKVGPGKINEFGNFSATQVKPGDVVYLFDAYDKILPVILGADKFVVCRERAVIGYKSKVPRPAADASLEFDDIEFGV